MSKSSFKGTNKFFLFRKIHIVAGVLLLMVFILFAGRIFQDRYTRALRLIVKEKYESSVLLLTASITTHPYDIKSYRKLAEVFYLQNKEEAGISYFNKLEKEKPDNPLIAYGRAYLHQKLGQSEKAADEYEAILLLLPPSTLIYRDYIDNCEKLNTLPLADSILQGLVNKYPENGALLNGFGYLALKQRRWQEGIRYLDSSIQKGDDILEAYLLKGVILFSTGNYDSFLETSKEGFQKSKLTRELRYQCIFMGNTGLAFNYLGNYPEAIKYTQKAIKLARKSGEIQEEVRSTGNLALVFRDTQKYTKSIEFIQKAIQGAIQIKDRNREGLFYRNMGSVYHMMGEYAKATEYLNKSLSIATETGDQYTECLTLLSMALAQWNLGAYESAVSHALRSLEIARNTGNRWAEGRCFSTIGLIYWVQGLYSKALNYSEKSLAIAEEIGDLEGESYCLGNMAIIYNDIGEIGKTIDYYSRALETAKRIGNRSEIGRNLSNIGCTYHKLEDFSAALNYYKQALEVFQEIGDQKELAEVYGNLGILMIDLNENSRAEEYLNQALAIGQDIKAESSITKQLLSLGFLELKGENYEAAFSLFSEALKRAHSLNSSQFYWQAHSGLAMVSKEQNKFDLALEHYTATIDKIEETQRILPIDNYQSSFLDEHINVYENILELLSEMHKNKPSGNYDKQAFHFSERAKGRAFLRNLVESRADVNSGVSPALKLREQEILNHISDKQKQLFQDDLTPRKRKELLSELGKHESEFDKLKREIKTDNAKYIDLYNPEPIDAYNIQKDILHTNEVILEYSLGENKSFLCLISKDKFSFFELPPAAIIEQAVDEYLQTIEKPASITNPHLIHLTKGKIVFDLLLKHFLHEFAEEDHLIIVADGILHRLPFESIIVNNASKDTSPRYLIQDYTVSYSPSSTSLAYLRNHKTTGEKEQKYFLAFADPVFHSTPVLSETTERGTQFQRNKLIASDHDEEGIFSPQEIAGIQLNTLPFSRTEVQEISDLFPPNKSVTYFGLEASEKKVKNEMLDQYKYVHFATHGLIEEEKPFRSGIMLSVEEGSEEDGLLQVNEILNLKLNAEMVVLSACQTAKGKLYRGEGIVGISRSFIYAGSSSVVVSLWNINDRSTAELMTKFYRHMKNSSDKSTALKNAKLTMIESENAYRHPYYWAPYILMGDPK